MRNGIVTAAASRHLATLVLQRLLLVALLLGLWWWGATRVPSFVLPGPEKVGLALISLWHSDTFAADVAATCRRVLSGFVLATFVGSGLGLTLGASRVLARFFEPVLTVFNTVSSAI